MTQLKIGEPLDFETTLSELEKIVAELEGDVKLEQALSLFDRGMQLSNNCQKFLQSASQKVEVLKRTSEGAFKLEPFQEEEIEN